MDKLFLAFLACAFARPSIHLVDIKPKDEYSVARIQVHNSNLKNHNVELMKNENMDNKAKWVFVRCVPSDVATNDFYYTMPPDLEKEKYYSFRLVEGNRTPYTKPMYLDNKGEWIDPQAQKDDIQKDKGRGKDKNGAADNILGLSVCVLCGMLFL